MPLKTFFACYPCLLRQIIEATDFLELDESISREIINETLQLMLDMDSDQTSSEIAAQIHQNIMRRSNGVDPYAGVKLESYQKAAALYDHAKDIIENSDDPLNTAVKVCAAGNVIDFGPSSKFDLTAALMEALETDFTIFDISEFKNYLLHSEKILFLADNAGETVFDRLLIEQIAKPLKYVVKAGPIMNDATYEDAARTGFPDYVEVIDNSTAIQGTVLSRASEEFKEVFTSADMIISKGMANFETLPEECARAFFLLKIKCQPVAEIAGIPFGSYILKQRGIFQKAI